MSITSTAPSMASGGLPTATTTISPTSEDSNIKRIREFNKNCYNFFLCWMSFFREILPINNGEILREAHYKFYCVVEFISFYNLFSRTLKSKKE